MMDDFSSIIDKHFYMSDGGRIYSDIINSIEKSVIIKALEQTDGNQLRTSRLLGVNRNTLHKKILRYSIDVRRFKR
ncbi:MAG: helix-turn-helix domain-containing protein [Candidatus Omnitrophica bacterium]|jgi:DNA-binding protein Fis|nr:helix-turn-helix domain-containing protein [Candidatus Omnitrophota bacterium]